MLFRSGYEFNEFDERLSPEALRNLDLAVEFFKKAALGDSFRDALSSEPESPEEGRK